MNNKVSAVSPFADMTQICWHCWNVSNYKNLKQFNLWSDIRVANNVVMIIQIIYSIGVHWYFFEHTECEERYCEEESLSFNSNYWMESIFGVQVC